MTDITSLALSDKNWGTDFSKDEAGPFDFEVSRSLLFEPYLIEKDAVAAPKSARARALEAIVDRTDRGVMPKAPAAKRTVSTSEAAIKRAIDIVASLAAILLLSPIILAIVAILACRNGPVLFVQDRIGKGARTFRCYKFRTMAVGADVMLAALFSHDPQKRAEWRERRKLADDPRVTRLGKFLRLTSLDELPQLLNVLKGDMSFVGPRPIVPSEIAKYQGFYPYYLAVKPGLTGMWQVNGRNRTTYHRRVALDVAYVRNQSLAMDARIIAQTLPALFRLGEVS